MADVLAYFQQPLTTISTDQVVVAVAGVRQQLNAGLACVVVSVAAKPANTGNIYLGSVAVTAANGRILAPGDVIDMSIDNLNRLYIDAAVNGEGISYLALA